MGEIDKSRTPLPADRAFVIQFYSSRSVEVLEFKGRVEHLTSGKAKYFSSRKNLYNIMETILSEDKHGPE